MKAKEVIEFLKNEEINTWFDLGLFLDRLKENNPVPVVAFNGELEEYFDYLQSRGIAFLTYAYSVDGVTNEILKYINSLKYWLNDLQIHLIAGEFRPDSYKLIKKEWKKYTIEEAQAFDKWKYYRDFFYNKLERGSKKYNQLILDFWEETLVITQKLAKYIERNRISTLYLVNVCSNPGNVSLSLASVLVSELMGIPVVSNNHDFYWEGGNRPEDIRLKRVKPGPRDFFFANSHLGEVFSIIEVLFPWESRTWISVNINKQQSEHVIKYNGHNPVNVTEIGTSVDVTPYLNVSKRDKINTFYQFEKVLSRYEKSLISYSVKDVINRGLVKEGNAKPLLIGHSKTRIVKDFLAENIIFLQPTRIIARKRIETGFRLIHKLFEKKEFALKFKETGNLKITLIVTGPIAEGHHDYLKKLLKRFQILLDSLKEEYRSRVYLVFLFSELDKEEFKKRFNKPVGIPELYNISSLILLPSETEGRGLPIIEAAASGKPIFCRRYYPEHVYSEVIGEHLPEKERLRVIEYDGKNISNKQLDEIIKRVFFPHMFLEEIEHNRFVVLERYSQDRLNHNIYDILKVLYYQQRDNSRSIEYVKNSFEEYRKTFDYGDKNLKKILLAKNREYLPGFNRLAFMIYLKSLIDPSAFRMEEQNMRGMIFNFAKGIYDKNPVSLSLEKKILFFNAVDNIFRYRNGELKIRHDHSMAYRHRNKYDYPYRDYTFQEITGFVNYLYRKLLKRKYSETLNTNTQFFTDWNLAIAQLTGSDYLGIDNRDILMQKMKDNIPIVIFPGSQILYALEFFALQSIRARLGLKLEEELTEKKLVHYIDKIAPVYLFLQNNPISNWVSTDTIVRFIRSASDKEMHLLYRKGLLKFVNTNQWTVGIHFAQLGKNALLTLRKVSEAGGLLITDRINASVMTDFVEIDRIHIGKAENPLIANMLGIPEGSGYIQYVPAGVRATLSYPTPVQTAADFDRILHSKQVKKLVEEKGWNDFMEIVREDARENGSPLKHVVSMMNHSIKMPEKVKYRFISGVYQDGYPWSGAFANTEMPDNGRKWQFETVYNNGKTKKVTTFVDEFQQKTGKKVLIAWNGGYILNPELVGKLGLPESYIGSPLGFLVSHGKVVCPPLFNKPALVIYKDGRLDIKRVNLNRGFVIKTAESEILFSSENRNQCSGNTQPCYYDLMNEEEYLDANGRIFVRLAGSVIKEVIRTRPGDKVRIIPVGLTLSFHPDHFPEELDCKEKTIAIEIPQYEDVFHAVEAGPMLVNDGEVCIDMEKEGWKKQNSIRTQAARLDFTDMRGPKIAAGIDGQGRLSVLTINGRIRESVGATHFDMAEIMKTRGIIKAMGFDPGGSSTLVVDGEVLNISPYNSRYEENIYSLPPEPRAVANAVLGYLEKA
ncbi:MAG: phosphodiester glycosidase family protein [Bacteroidales bacterium]|nr:phosphodiester glycosidase family protein [Bacteroidales bacterium]